MIQLLPAIKIEDGKMVQRLKALTSFAKEPDFVPKTHVTGHSDV